MCGEHAGDLRHAVRFVARGARTESLGGDEWLIEHPATTSHTSMRPAQRAAASITENVIRLSMDIEWTDNLVADLQQALSTVTSRPHQSRPNSAHGSSSQTPTSTYRRTPTQRSSTDSGTASEHVHGKQMLIHDKTVALPLFYRYYNTNQ